MKQATVIRLFLIGLPVGLILTTAGSMVWHFSRPDEDPTPRIYTTLAEEVTETVVMNYVRNVSEVIGPRHATLPGTLERTANYLESTLGPRNLGYDVKQQVYEIDGQPARNLWVDIPGGKRVNEVIMVAANYDANAGHFGKNENASGVATVLALAENLTRDKPMLSIRLALLSHGASPFVGTPDSGAAHLVSLMQRQGNVVQGVLCLEGIGAFPVDALGAPASFLPEKGPYLSLLANEASKGFLSRSFDRLAPLLTITTHQAAVTESEAALLTQSMAGSFHQGGYSALLVTGNGRLVNAGEDLPVDGAALTEVVRGMLTLVRVLANP